MASNPTNELFYPAYDWIPVIYDNELREWKPLIPAHASQSQVLTLMQQYLD